MGVTRCQVPATAGVRVGRAVWAPSGSENWTVTVVSDGTPVAPSTGETATTFRGRLEGAGWAAGVVVGAADTLPPVEWATTATAPIPTRATAPSRRAALRRP